LLSLGRVNIGEPDLVLLARAIQQCQGVAIVDSDNAASNVAGSGDIKKDHKRY
jgi:hypothetical protein